MSLGIHRFGTALCWAALVLLFAAAGALAADPPRPRKIVLIAGKKSHGPGEHEYEKSVRLLKVLLDASPNLSGIKTEYHLNGWPTDPATLDDADTIMTISDGQDGDKFSPVPWMTPERMPVIERQMKRGCGLVTFHFSTFAPHQYAPQILDWTGGFFDWQNAAGQREWFSKITTLDTTVKLAAPEHPIARGLADFQLRDEFYHNIRFREGDMRLTPIAAVPALGGGPLAQTVAWAVTRKDGGRGFATTTGHFFKNWENPSYRKLILNALVWSAGGEVPSGGVQSEYRTPEEVERLLSEKPIRALIVTGHQHPAHAWRETTLALEDILRRDPRLRITTAPDPEFLARPELLDYQTLVLNYCNWEKPGLSEKAKTNLLQFLDRGGGLILVHFSNGAFHFSLPGAKDSDWPEYRTQICRRVWDHSLDEKTGKMKSGHDAYGPFRVELTRSDHPITKGLTGFDTTDELYFNQQGDAPIQVLVTARSRITGKDEPLAMVYEHRGARIFQTLLGHSADSLRPENVGEIIRRAAAWTARREPWLATAAATTGAAPKASDPVRPAKGDGAGEVQLVPGRLGKALAAARSPLVVKHHPAFDALPLTIECFARLENKQNFNILVAKNDKASGKHWELFTQAQSGHLAAYLPGFTPDHVRSSVDVSGDWHHLALLLEENRGRLLVDGKVVADQPLRRTQSAGGEGPLWVGAYPSHGLGCTGLIDEVRISRGLREINTSPKEPLTVDERTIALWRFDAVSGGAVADESPQHHAAAFLNVAAALQDASQGGAASPAKEPAKTAPAKPAAAKPKNHWGEEAIGFKWQESDSRDDRWSKMDTGPFFSGTIAFPDGRANRGIAIRIGERQEGAVLFDAEQNGIAAAWSGDFLQFDPARYGLTIAPKIAGTALFSLRTTAAWGEQKTQYQGLYRNGRRITLRYAVGDVGVSDSPWLERQGEMIAVTRTLTVAAHATPIALALATESKPDRGERTDVAGKTLVRLVNDARQIAAGLAPDAPAGAELAVREQSLVLQLAASDKPQTLKVLLWSGPLAETEKFALLVKASPACPKESELIEPGARLWGEPLVTKGVRGEGSGSYVVDTLTLPFDNPHRALLFTSGHDFFANGDIAVCTVHGDVWRVSGDLETLAKLRWTRLATGLYQPLGLKIAGDQVYVLGRDQITRLSDRNGDGEADFYECFSAAGPTSAFGHDYTACLETDSAGNFYFLKPVPDPKGAKYGQGTLFRVSPDGRRTDVVADGFRNPIGLGVGGPNDSITVSPQEGEWTPASCIAQVKQGGYYGFGGPRISPERPLGYDPPLVWLPRMIDNSSGGQCTVSGGRWGPLEGQLLHFSYGRCWPLVVLRDSVEGTAQGAVYKLNVGFESGVMRGRFSPRDGQLYVTGLRGWTTSAARDGCLQRLRFTGREPLLPVSWHVHANGVAIGFSQPLDPVSCEDSGNYSLQQWNYQYRAEYGSPDLKVSNPTEEGQDEVPLRRALLLADRKTVFLEVGQLRPVMQWAVKMRIRSAAGETAEPTVIGTIHAVPKTPRELPAPSSPSVVSVPPASVTPLAPGVLVRFRQQAGEQELRDCRVDRLVALRVENRSAPAAFLRPLSESSPSASSQWQGFVSVPLNGDYQFKIVGNTQATLQINSAAVTKKAAGEPESPAASVALRKGANPFQMDAVLQAAASGSQLRLVWSGPGFAWEPVPPAALFHDPLDKELAEAAPARTGRELFASLACIQCHALPDGVMRGQQRMPELEIMPPMLVQARNRFRPEWLFQRILDPASVASHSVMPQVTLGDTPAARRALAADLTAYLGVLGDPPAEPKIDELDPAARERLIERGLTSYENLGCIACHRLTPPAEKDRWDRHSLHFVAAKYQPPALAAVVQFPHRHDANFRMPDLKLTADEAQAIAAYLSANGKGVCETPAELAAANANNGRKVFYEVGCSQCHAVGPRDAAKLRPLDLARASGGCLAADAKDRRTAPAYRLATEQRAALVAFLGRGLDSLAFDPPLEFADRAARRFQCAACHGRDQAQALLPKVLVEEGLQGLAPDLLPNLTWSGEKLHGRWLARQFSGSLSYRSRPWLTARMPALPFGSDELAAGLAAQHGLAASEPLAAARSELVEAGRQLASKERGLDCRQCHSLGPQTVRLDNNAQGVSFLYAAERVRPEYYQRWIRDPLRFDPGSKMPKFSLDGQRTTIREFFDGDAARQFDALWEYIRQVPQEPTP